MQAPPVQPARPVHPGGGLTFSNNEIRDYSLARALDGSRSGVWRGATHEREISQHIARAQGSIHLDNPHSCFVPAAVLAAGQRDLQVAMPTGGATLVGREVLGVVDALRPRSLAFRLGALGVTGLRSDATYASVDGGATITWLSNEGASAAASTFTISGLTMAPRTVSAYVNSSRQIGLQAPVLSEYLLRQDLLAALAQGLDAAIFAGTGAAGQPRGLAAAPGTTVVSGAGISYATVLGAQTTVLTSNALSGSGELAYVCRPAVAELLARRQGFSANAPMWIGNLADGELAGCPAASTMNMPAGVLLCCDFSRVLVAEWGVGAIELRADPYTNFAKGLTGHAAFLSVDVGLLAPAAVIANGVT